jgi:hypothetical protein
MRDNERDLVGTSPVIAERVLLLDGLPAVKVRLFKPVADERLRFVCRYEVEGLVLASPGFAVGGDALEALMLALNRLAVVVEGSPEAQTGRLHWPEHGSNLGFMLPEALRRSGFPATNAHETAYAAASRPASPRQTSELPDDVDTLRRWSCTSDDALRGIFSIEAQQILARVISALFDVDVFAPVTRDTFPAVVRLLNAAVAHGARGLMKAMADGGEYKDAGRLQEFRVVLQRFAEQSPTKFHRDIALRYADESDAGPR